MRCNSTSTWHEARRGISCARMSEPEILAYLQTAREAGHYYGRDGFEKAVANDAELLANFNCAVAAQNFFRVFLLRYRVKRFWYDTEIEGRAAEQAFETELSRINRALHPGTSFKARCRSSHQSDMVQIADSVAYIIRRHSAGTIKHRRRCDNWSQRYWTTRET